MKYVIFLLLALASIQLSAENYGYDPDADPYQLLNSAAAKAKKENKLVLVVLGAAWCPDCSSFDNALKNSPLAETIESKFQLIHVDVGYWDNNLDFNQKFGNPIAQGIPSIAILDGDLGLHLVADGGEFASARHSNTQSLNEWFLSIASEIEKRSDAEFDKSIQPFAQTFSD